MLRVLEPGLLATIQDEGRPAAAHLGVPRSGACDAWSMHIANLLLSNEAGAAVLEMSLLGATFEITMTGVIAIAGADMGARIVEEDRPLATGASHLVRAGTTLHFGPATRGVRTYLALPGGVDVGVVLGSRSTCLAGGFGGLEGRPLMPGDRLDARADPMAPRAGRSWSAGGFDPTDPEAEVTVVAVPDAPGVHRDALDALIARPWTVSPVGDRTGLRLEGEALPTSQAADTLVSGGVMPGAIQVPPSGLPIVLLADAPTLGGYPVPAVVARADLAIVAQRQSGVDLRFVAITPEEARMASAERRIGSALL